MKPTLVVLAAGMGSRYGGLKQIDPVGPSGEAILDYSVFDAIRGGFGRVVFIIRRDIESEFRTKIGAKYAGHIDVGYAFQDITDLPSPYTLPDGRAKPWGTAHAVRAARDVVKGPFAVINADDFYGRDSFAKLGAALSSQAESANSIGKASMFMVGFRLDRTLSENGSVARGICTIDGEGCLTGVTERTKIVSRGEVAVDEESGVVIPLDSRASMNCWGFPAGLFAELEARFPAWLEANIARERSEWYIPMVVDELIREGRAKCRVLPTESQWFGVTYREDKPMVVDSIAKLVAAGEYPEKLF